MDILSTELPAIIYARPRRNPTQDWREIQQGPGVFHLDEGEETGVRLRNIGDGELEQFVNEASALGSLVMLNLSENRSITDEGLEKLAQLKGLKILNLSSCSITSTGMQFLKDLPHLVQLDLSYCNRINDLGLRVLKNLPNLAVLNLQGCSKVTNGGVSKLRRPGLEIKK
jgi:hypothetical protein